MNMKTVTGLRLVYGYLAKLLLLLVLLDGIRCVRINRLEVPEVTQLGDPVVLDCDYTLEDSLDDGLVVKWFFNKNPTPIYQWIPNKKPQELGILKGRLNLDYSASKDTNSIHRALHIIEPGPDLSGNYTCMVSTFGGEDTKTKRMLVLVPSKNLELSLEYLGRGMIQVMCFAEGVFPRPNMSLRIGNSEANNTVISIEERSGLYDIKAVAEVPKVEVPKELNTSCELRIPQANYTVKKEAVYYPSMRGGQKMNSPFYFDHLMLLFLHLPLYWG